MWICSNCDKLLDESVTLCPGCGATPPHQPARKNCVACRRDIPASSLYCPECGSYQKHRELVRLACTLKQVNNQWDQASNAANNIIRSLKHDMSGSLSYDGRRLLFVSPGSPNVDISLNDIQWAVLNNTGTHDTELLIKHRQGARYILFSTANVAAARQIVDTLTLRVK